LIELFIEVVVDSLHHQGRVVLSNGMVTTEALS